MKECKKCGEMKPLESYNKHKQTKDKHRSECKSCQAEANADLNLKRNYGISLAEYDKMLEEQEGRCKICKTKNPLGKGRFHVDHCHHTKEVRGLLCHNCNRGLGYFKDSKYSLTEAIRYLNGSS